MDPAWLARFLHPTTVAVVGGTRAAEAVAQSDRLGFAGEIWPVHPTRRTVGGRTVTPTIGALPGPPDAALIAVDRTRTIAAVRQLRERGCGGVVCYASGFAEVGVDGTALQAALLDAAGGMPLLGPNCHGFVDARSGAALWPDVHGCRRVDRGVAVVTQSGNLALNITMHPGLPIAQVVTVGNQAGVRLEDCVAALAGDPGITAIGVHVEALTDPVAFGEAAIRAWEHDVPIVVLQTGVSATGAAIARTHTASLAGRHATYRSLFSRYRVVVVDTVPDLVATLSVLHAHGWLDAARAVSLSCSGGEAALVADRSARHGVRFPPLPADVVAEVGAALDHRVAVTNPLDYHTYRWGDRVALERCFSAALSAPVDVGLLVIDFPAAGHDDRAWQTAVEAVVGASRTIGRPVVITSTLPENLPAALAADLAGRTVPAIGGVDIALAAIAASVRPRGRPSRHDGLPAAGGRTVRTCDPFVARTRLADVGVAVPFGRFCTRAEIGAVADDVGFPVTLKAVGFDHKTEVGGVAVDLRTAAEVHAALAAMADLGDHFLVERHVPRVVAELLVGVRREEPVGWTVTIGAGGVLVDLLDEAVTLLAPVTTDEVLTALRSLKVGRVLGGHRSRPVGDVAAAADAICRIVEVATSDPTIVEVEVNPLLVLVDGVSAVDALILEVA